jgi:hypothetical protein
MLFDIFFQMGDCISLPIVLTYSFTFLFKTLGLSFLTGIGVFIIAFFFNIFVGLKLEKT